MSKYNLLFRPIDLTPEELEIQTLQSLFAILKKKRKKKTKKNRWTEQSINLILYSFVPFYFIMFCSIAFRYICFILATPEISNIWLGIVKNIWPLLNNSHYLNSSLVYSIKLYMFKMLIKLPFQWCIVCYVLLSFKNVVID